ncbi:DUF7620 family protein [Nocardia pulmonis]|uniref:DUF7620 family protein n=1 Tax=Nocardia pulmonis TaxID=2951408 RepID=UPI003FD8C83F
MWRRRRNSPPESDETRKAREAAERAEAQRRRVEARWPDINRIGAALENALRRNHFGEQIERSFALRRNR